MDWCAFESVRDMVKGPCLFYTTINRDKKNPDALFLRVSRRKVNLYYCSMFSNEGVGLLSVTCAVVKQTQVSMA